MSASVQLPDGRSLALDEHGYLTDWTAWDGAVAEALARVDGMELTEAHWQVIELLRDYYRQYEIAPPMRALVGALKRRRPDLASSRVLYRLFPEGPARQASRYAGLPIPVSCI